MASPAAPAARAQSEINLRVEHVDARGFPRVKLLATATDARGRTIVGLQSSDFTIWEDGRSVPIDRAASTEISDAPVSIVLAIDKSCLVYPLLDQIKAAAGQLLARLTNSGDQAALILMGNQPEVYDFNTPQAIANTLAQLGPDALDPNQALNSGAYQGIRLAAARPSGHRAVLLLTSGRDVEDISFASPSLGDALNEAAILRVPLYVLDTGAAGDDQGRVLLDSDGRRAAIGDPAALARRYDEIAGELRRRYAISYRSRLPSDGQLYMTSLSVRAAGAGMALAPLPVQSAFTPTDTPTPTSTPTPTPSPTNTPTVTSTTTTTSTLLLGGVIGAGTTAALLGGPLLLLLALALGGFVFAMLAQGGNAGSAPGGRLGPRLPRTSPSPATAILPGAAVAPTIAAQLPAATLVAERGSASPPRLVLPLDRPVLLGGSPNADMVLAGGGVAVWHARIRFADGGYTITDLTGAAGVRVNGRPVDSMRLRIADRIEIGEVVLVLYPSAHV